MAPIDKREVIKWAGLNGVLIKNQDICSSAIISFILMTCMFDQVVIP